MVALGVMAACKSPCRQLSEKLCDCAINSFDKNACLQKVSQQESSVVLTPADNARCAPLVDICDCRLTDTAQGKTNCGLAWPLDSGIAY
jgi:hypothetical protein